MQFCMPLKSLAYIESILSVRYSHTRKPSIGPSCAKRLFRTDDDDLSYATSLVTILFSPVAIRRKRNVRVTIHPTVCFSFTRRVRSSARELMVTSRDFYVTISSPSIDIANVGDAEGFFRTPNTKANSGNSIRLRCK
jgi:hypothetical protein